MRGDRPCSQASIQIHHTSAASKPKVRMPNQSSAAEKPRLSVSISIAAISAALGWQAHTTRAAITGLRKAGHAVETAKLVDGSIGLEFVTLAERLETALGRKVDVISRRALKPALRRLIEQEAIDVEA